MRRETPLGRATTGDDGRYEIAYTPPATPTNLVVHVLDGAGNVLAESPVIFRARPVETVDLTVDQGRVSEFESQLASLQPLLGDVDIVALQDTDVAFLAREADMPALNIAWMSVAFTHARTTRVPPEAYYGLFRQNLPTSLPALAIQGSAALRAALQRSIDQQVIPASMAAQLESIIDALHGLLDLSTTGTTQAPAWVALLGLAGVSPADQTALLKAYIERSGTVRDFWTAVRRTPLGVHADAVQDVLRLVVITGHNMPLVAALQSAGARSPRDLADLGAGTLTTIIAGSDAALSGVPSIDANETRDAKAARYAGEILAIANAACPTAFLRARLSAASDGNRRDAARVLAAAPDFELRDGSIDQLLKDRPQVLAGVSNADGTVALLKGFQRTLRVAPMADHADALVSAGLDSARAIVSLAPQAFVDQFGPQLGGPEQAKLYYAKGEQISGKVEAFASMANAAQDVLPMAISGGKAAQPHPDFASLFGSFSLCECEDCRSVYSPAAYLVDLLHFIDPKAGVRPIDTLRQRRPDIEYIPLTCENTNTAMPYVDLVNEVLEWYVAHGSIGAGAAHDTGQADAEDLNVVPQFVLDAAYDTLQAAVYPPSLPFHHPLETMRAYLAQLGTTRAAVMRTFRRAGVPAEADIDLESAGMSVTERDILTGKDAHALSQFYGYGANDQNWLSSISNVSEFLRRTETTYAELLQLLATTLVNADLALELSEQDNPPTCDLTQTVITNLDAARLGRIHRFLRLSRTLQWSISALDLACAAFQKTDIDQPLLQALALVRQVASTLQLPLGDVLSLNADMDAALYARVFQGKTLMNAPDPNLGLGDPKNLAVLAAALRLSASDLAIVRADASLLDDKAPINVSNLSQLYKRAVLARALNLGVAQFRALRVLIGSDPFQPHSPAALVDFVEHVRRVKASAFPLEQFSYLYLSDPASLLAPQVTELDTTVGELLGGLGKIAEDNAAAPELVPDLARGFVTQTVSNALALESATAGALLSDVLASTADAATPALSDFTGVLGDGLAATYFQDVNLANAKATTVAATIDFDWSGTQSPDPAINAAAFSARWTGRIAAPAADTYTLIVRARGGVRLSVDGTLLIDKWAEASAVAEYTAAVTLGAAQPADLTLEFFKTGDRGTVQLLWSAASTPRQIVPHVCLYSNAAFSFDRVKTTYRRVHKAAMLVNAFRLSARELSYLAAHKSDFGGFDLNALPLDPGGFSPALFAQWERLQALVALRDGWPQAEATIIDVFEADAASAVGVLKQASGWDPVQLDFLAGPNGLTLSAGDFKNEISLVALRDCLDMSARIGVPCARLFAWAAAEPTAAIAKEAVSAVNAKYDHATWLQIAKPINDALRDLRRNALIAYLLAGDDMRQRGITTADQLFEFFLIDVEVEPGMMTSRIKQAISSVQLFVQRCLMGLELDPKGQQPLPSSLIDARQWAWMKSYRVWEANRKVFLYPENWLRPELRDDMTPFFRELETRLLQNDITADAAEDAFLDYLHKLDDVARLEIVGLYTEYPSPDQSTIVHVFGRTQAVPRRHYYRRQTDGVWSAWEKVDIDIESDHLIPVVYNRRLYLFWPHFEERPDAAQGLGAPYIETIDHWRWENADAASRGSEPNYSAPPPLSHHEIKLCWSEYRSGRWSAKQTSADWVTSPAVQSVQTLGFVSPTRLAETTADIYLPQPSEHFFRTDVEKPSNDLLIRVFRRFRHTYQILDIKSEWHVNGYDQVGSFRLACGATVVAASDLQAIGQLPVMPQDTTNDGMQFRSVDPPSPLALSQDGTTTHVLGTVASVDPYGVLPEHQFALFSLPAQSFFYQDKFRTYFAHHQFEPLSMLVAEKDVIPLPASVEIDAGLVSAVKAQPSVVPLPVSAQAEAAPAYASDSQMADSGGVMLQENQALATLVTPAVTMSLAQASFIKFETFFHPFVCGFLKALYRSGVPGLLDRAGTQQLDNDANETPQNLLAPRNVFFSKYAPDAIVDPLYPRENVDFDGGAYSVYNWELFFHAPMLIASALAQNQQFDEALDWLHYVFNPTATAVPPPSEPPAPVPQRYWNTLPFFRNDHPEKDRIQELLAALDSDLPADTAVAAQVSQQIEAWRADPFNPHLIARMRITAYQKNVVMTYIDVLVQYGDLRFAQNTIESINEATLYYVLAQSILGPRPVPVPPHTVVPPKTYKDLEGSLDDFSNALVQFENAVPYSNDPVKVSDPAVAKNAAQTLYFCVPPNSDMRRCWDTVDDRLFKIRHSLNIEGQAQTLPLFEPPIDPGLLVKAKAAGIDLASVLSDVAAPAPCYRFSYMLPKALELCGELKALGGALLAALEKQDAEGMAALRASHETALFRAVREVRRQQIDEANETLEGLRRSQLVVEQRRDYYRDIVRISDAERTYMNELGAAQTFNENAQLMAYEASVAHLIPDFHGGGAGFSSPFAITSFGGSNVGAAMQAASSALNAFAGIHTHDATMASIRGGYDRRWDDWKQQEKLANRELDQIGRQIAAGEIRAAIAQREADNQDLQIEQSQEVEDVLRTKYTNRDLYAWMAGQISKVYFQAYKLAYDLAKRAERAYQFERGLTDSNYVRFGYWDNLRKGLLAGEQLALDLKRLEAAYLDQNRREFEITKQISLAAVDPLALLKLKETGQCDVSFDEPLFDMDFPGHHMRRIRTVALTIPCVVGPYTSVNATLTLLHSRIRVDNDGTRPYAEDHQGEDPRFLHDFSGVQSIAVSHAQNDSGLFELNFHDERYLPFEGAGAVSTWRLELTKDFRAFDFDTISDVIVHMRYTARDGGATLKAAAIGAAKTWVADQASRPPARLFSAKHEFPNDWYRFLNPLDGATSQTLALDLGADRFPFPFRGSDIGLIGMEFFLKLKAGVGYKDNAKKNLQFDLTKTGGSAWMHNELTVAGSPFTGIPYTAIQLQGGPGAWTLTVNEADLQALDPSNGALRRTVKVDSVDHVRLNPDAIDDLWIVCHYTAKTQ